MFSTLRCLPRFTSSLVAKMAIAPRRQAFATATTAMVKELRARTGAPMMDCKKALESPDVEGDVSKAVDWLRKKGISKVASSGDRKAEEGLIAVLQNNNKVTLLEINSETDFVSRNVDFQAFVAQMAATVNGLPSTGPISSADLLKSKPVNSKLANVEELLGDIVSKIRENIVIRKAVNVNISDDMVVASYVHNKVSWGGDSNLQLGRSAAVISLSVGPSPREKSADEAAMDVAKKLAMHIVAAKPQYLTQKDIPNDVREREKAIFAEQTAAAMAQDTKGGKKTPEMIEKIVMNKVNKRLSEICLVDQSHFAEEGSPIISKHLEAASKVNKLKLEVSSFHLWSLGGSSKNSG